MASNAIISLRKVMRKVQEATKQAASTPQLKSLAQFAITLVVKRTLLGYGVNKQYGNKVKLKPLSERYIAYRKRLRAGNSKSKIKLSENTTPKRSNLTLTGQMLGSMAIIEARNGSISIGPRGNRYDSRKTNQQVAALQELQGRTFNRISELEFNQILRFYRKNFGDLLRKKNLIR